MQKGGLLVCPIVISNMQISSEGIVSSKAVTSKEAPRRGADIISVTCRHMLEDDNGGQKPEGRMTADG